MKTETCLFIGGPADGQVIEIYEKMDYTEVRRLKDDFLTRATPYEPYPPTLNEVSYETITYYKKRIRIDDGPTACFLVLSGTTAADIFARLIQRYSEKG